MFLSISSFSSYINLDISHLLNKIPFLCNTPKQLNVNMINNHLKIIRKYLCDVDKYTITVIPTDAMWCPVQLPYPHLNEPQIE